jgi:hypothetical protein
VPWMMLIPSSQCAHQEIWVGSIQMANSAEIARASRAVANHRSMRRTSPGPIGACSLCKNRL